MRTLRNVISAIAIAVPLAATVMTQSEAAGGAPFDGTWSVLIQTSQGQCGSYRAALQISDGRVMSFAGDYGVSGVVNASGATAVTVVNEEGSATGTGRLQGSSGSGQWRSSTGACAGTWSATKR
jgi:hypothetical protein